MAFGYSFRSEGTAVGGYLAAPEIPTADPDKYEIVVDVESAVYPPRPAREVGRFSVRR